MQTWLKELEARKRIEEKLDAAKATLGTKWVLHPVNHVKKPCPPSPR
jgi:hypothetical protein